MSTLSGNFNRFSIRARRPQKSPIRNAVKAQAIRARWKLDVRYGTKMEALELLQQWIRDIGSQAGASKNNTTLMSGAVGSPESRFELEFEFESLAALEEFWAAIPAEEHGRWSLLMRNYIIDGSPTWEILRTCGSLADAAPTAAEPSASSPARLGDDGRVTRPAGQEQVEECRGQAVPVSTETSESGLEVVRGAEDAATILDWKGDPMRIRPGDKLPFKFL